MLQSLILAGSWFSLFLAIHIIWFHRVHVEQCFALIVKIFGVCVAGDLVMIAAMPPSGQRGSLFFFEVGYGLVMMGCLFILYMPFYYTIVSSLSIQTLICIEESPEEVLSMEELRQRFASRETLDGRLSIMVGNGYLTEQAGRYRVTSKARLVSRFFSHLKELWKLGPGG